MNHPLQCSCGAVRGSVSNAHRANHVVCYCADCQAFARFLGREDEVLDELGGSEVIQTLPKNVVFAQGVDSLACMRLTEKGLLRWYAACCKTPIGNTLDTCKISFIGLVHTCLKNADHPLDQSFGPVRSRVNTENARADPKPKQAGVGASILWFLGTTTRARLNGDFRHNPFFHAETGLPIAEPRILNLAERLRCRGLN